MGLKLNELQKVVKNVVKNERNIDTLRGEIVRTLGHIILVSRGLERMAESANERLDVLEATNKSYEKIRPALLLKFIDSSSPEVRKLVARLLPESFLKPLMKDSDPAVRATVANRLPTHLVDEMIRRFPKDDTLRQISKAKKLFEAGLPTPEIEDEEFDMYGLEPIGDVFGDIDYPDLTDAWYDTQALKIINMYGRNIEEQWEEATVHQYVDSMASMGVEVDRQRLLDAIYDLLEQRADAVLEENSLVSIAARLRLEETAVMPIISESIDPVRQLIESKNSSSDYIKKFEELFSVKYATSKNPAASIMTESDCRVTHPVSARLSSESIRNVDEKAIDTYISAWNSKNKMKGENYYKLAWTQGDADGLINFHLELK
jgi:hypothetical protein